MAKCLIGVGDATLGERVVDTQLYPVYSNGSNISKTVLLFIQLMGKRLETPKLGPKQELATTA